MTLYDVFITRFWANLSTEDSRKIYFSYFPIFEVGNAAFTVPKLGTVIGSDPHLATAKPTRSFFMSNSV